MDDRKPEQNGHISTNKPGIYLPPMASHPTLQTFVSPSASYSQNSAERVPPIYRHLHDHPPPEFSSQQPKPAQYSQKKPKRKSQTDVSPDSSAVDQQTGQPIKKRQRTARSCDSCRYVTLVRSVFLNNVLPLQISEN